MYPIRTAQPYNPANLAATGNTYTTVYLGNYVDGDFGEGDGSHCGVDIIPMVPEDTIMAALSGTVVTAGTNASDGNYVVVRHDGVVDPATGTSATYYSCYLHLSQIAVAQGQAVAEGDAVGKCGNTGNSTGEHLHFQMDTANAPFHPYWPFTFADSQKAGLGFDESVNQGLGLANARLFTVNPLPLLDRISKAGASAKPSPVTAPAQTVQVAAVTVPAPAPAPIPTPAANPRPVSDAAAPVFSDVPANHPYADAIEFVARLGIATGQNGLFRPEDTVSRGELLKMGFLAAKTPLSDDAASHFSDVPAGSPFLAYVNTARAKGIVSGYADGTFRPNDPVTRAEGLKILLGLFGIATSVPAAAPYPDVPVSAWYAGDAQWCKDNGALAYRNSGFSSDAPLSRAESANVIRAAMMAA